MKRAIFSLLSTAVMAVPAMTVCAVGVPVDEIVVPVDSITVDESSLRPPSQEKILDMALNDSSESNRLLALGHIFDQRVLVDIIRKDPSSKVRLAAFDRIVDGDAIFRMIFKPGEKSTGDVRLAAINAVAEIEVVRVVSEKSTDIKAKNVASSRLSSVYAADSDRGLPFVHPSVRAAAIRSSNL